MSRLCYEHDVRPSVRQSVGLQRWWTVITNCNETFELALDRIGRCPLFWLPARWSQLLSILWSWTLLRKTSGCGKMWGFCTSAAWVQRFAF